MIRELEQSLGIPVQLVPLEELSAVLAQTSSGTVVTSRYFIGEVLEVTAPKAVRVIPVDIHDYADELKIVKDLPKDSCLGVVSLSSGTLGVVEIIIHSLRGDELLLMTAQVDDKYKLNALVRAAQTIISDQASYEKAKAAISAAREDLIRPPKLICSENYIGIKSVNLLKRELGLG
jgi:GntR family transcriptional regulator